MVQVDFSGFPNAVNTVGGIYLLPLPGEGRVLRARHHDAGCQLSSGVQALAIARARHYEYYANGYWHTDGTSDFGRIQRQDVFIKSMMSTAKSKVNPLTVNAFLGSVNQGIQIDDSFGFNELIGLALTYHSFDPTALGGLTLPTVAANGFGNLGDVLTVDQPAAQQMLVNVFGSSLVTPTNVPPDAAGNPNPPPAVTPTTVAPASPGTPTPAPTSTAPTAAPRSSTRRRAPRPDSARVANAAHGGSHRPPRRDGPRLRSFGRHLVEALGEGVPARGWRT